MYETEKIMLTIVNAKQSGGKAGKGKNKTTSFQVFDTETRCVLKSFSYIIGFDSLKQIAHNKAKKYIREHNA